MVMPQRHNNTFMGDPFRSLMTAEQNLVIKEDKLAELAASTGTYLAAQLKELSDIHPRHIQNVRGRGTFLAFDCANADVRNSLLSNLKAQGVN